MIAPSLAGRDVHVLLESEEEFYAEVLQVTERVVRVLVWGTLSKTRSIPFEQIIAADLVDLPRAKVQQIAAAQYQRYLGRSSSPRSR